MKKKIPNKKYETDAVKILYKKYIEGHPEREIKYAEAEINVTVGSLIYNYREEASLTQKQLAELVGTTQSVISRLEDADYEGHSISMLNRIAIALNKKLIVDMK